MIEKSSKWRYPADEDPEERNWLRITRMWKEEKFQEGDLVSWKKADPTDPRNKMTIIHIGKSGGTEKAYCRYIKTSDEDACSGRAPIVQPIEGWFPLSELEHFSATA